METYHRKYFWWIPSQYYHLLFALSCCLNIFLTSLLQDTCGPLSSYDHTWWYVRFVKISTHITSFQWNYTLGSAVYNFFIVVERAKWLIFDSKSFWLWSIQLTRLSSPFNLRWTHSFTMIYPQYLSHYCWHIVIENLN